jgi:hypothetical protein
MNNVLTILDPYISQRELRHLVKPGLILLILALAAVLGYQSTPRLLTMLTILVGGMIFAAILSRWLEAGLVLLLFVSHFIKFEVNTGTNIPLNASILLAGSLVAFWIVECWSPGRRSASQTCG